MSCIFTGIAQDKATFKVMFYNTENFFDTRDDSTRNDEDFLPTSKKHWTRERFDTKVSNLYKTIVACGAGHQPDIIGLCEVENDYCMKSLVLYSPLSQFEYRFVHYESTDPRGIDVALIYNPKTFKVLKSCPVPIVRDGKRQRTRDILMVKGVILPRDTVFVFVNHWSSRRGGTELSQVKREVAAQNLRDKVDSIASVNKNARIIIMGDLNDTPTDKSVVDVLGAKHMKLARGFLYDLANNYTFEGSYKYKGDWSTFDHLIVSSPLVTSFARASASVCTEPFLLQDDDKFTGLKPYKTYDGMKYLGGFSDHLPVMLDLRKQ